MDLNRILEIATEAHEGQLYCGHPFIVHPMAVARIAERYGFSKTIQAACLLHDIIEDTSHTWESLEALGVPHAVLNMVEAVTDEPGATRKERKVKTYAKLKGNKDAVVVKLCDRAANTMASLIFNPKHLKMYDSEYQQFELELFNELWEDGHMDLWALVYGVTYAKPRL